WRKTVAESIQTVQCGLGDYIYSFKKWYIRFDVAVGKVHENLPVGAQTTHTQADDILFSTGYRQTAVDDRLSLAYSLLLGIPTHKDHGFEYFQFGTGHSALGAQIDGIYTC